MKRFQALLLAALGGLIFVATLQASTQEGRPCYATIVRVEGLASYSLGDNNWRPLVAGIYLPAGSSIRTGEGGSVDAVLSGNVKWPQAYGPGHVNVLTVGSTQLTDNRPAVEQNVVRLTPNTLISIDKLTAADTGVETIGNTELDLKKGTIYARVKKFSPMTQFIIKTPHGVAGVRGTDLVMSADGYTAVFQTHVDGGLVVAITLPNGGTQTFVINAGQCLDLRSLFAFISNGGSNNGGGNNGGNGAGTGAGPGAVNITVKDNKVVNTANNAVVQDLTPSQINIIQEVFAVFLNNYVPGPTNPVYNNGDDHDDSHHNNPPPTTPVSDQ